MLLYIAIGAVGLFVVALIAATIESNKQGKEIAAHFLKLENKYQSFVENYIASHVLDQNNLEINFEALTKDVMIVIQPDLNGILALINATNYTSVDVPAKAVYFPNLLGMIQEFFVQSEKNESKKLSEKETASFFQSAQEAVDSDIKKRLLELRIKS